MRVIAVFNQKGGSCKTTTTVNLAATLSKKKRKVLVIDIDSQKNATEWLGLDDAERTIYDCLVNNVGINDIVFKTEIDGIDVIPASTWLVNIDKALANEMGVEQLLRIKLAELQNEYDYILIDCQPNINIMSKNALVAAEEILIPVNANVLGLTGIKQLLKTVKTVKERLNPNLEIAGVVPCNVNLQTNHARDVIEALKERFGKKLYKTVIRRNVRLEEAPSFKQPITTFAPRSIGYKDYTDLAKEVIKGEKR